MKEKEIDAHMQVAEIYSQLSHCERKKVGCIIVKDGRIISIGYNGTPSGWDNCCEEWVSTGEVGTKVLKTNPDVIHAEKNAIAKLAGSHDSASGASLFVTLAPCEDCALLIIQSGIKEVFYKEVYRDTTGLDFLEKAGIKTIQL